MGEEVRDYGHGHGNGHGVVYLYWIFAVLAALALFVGLSLLIGPFLATAIAVILFVVGLAIYRLLATIRPAA